MLNSLQTILTALLCKFPYPEVLNHNLVAANKQLAARLVTNCSYSWQETCSWSSKDRYVVQQLHHQPAQGVCPLASVAHRLTLPPSQVLSSDGYVGIVNCNPVFQPLMQEAALHCSNANVFWHWGRWEKGLLSKGLLINGNKQPFRWAFHPRTFLHLTCRMGVLFCLLSRGIFGHF